MDNRKHPRHSLQETLVAAVRRLIGYDDEGESVIHAAVTDLSREGAGLSVEVFSQKPHQVGDPIHVEIELIDGSMIGSEAEVKWTTPLAEDGGYQLGIQFVRIDNQDKVRLNRFIAELEAKLAR